MTLRGSVDVGYWIYYMIIVAAYYNALIRISFVVIKYGETSEV